MINPMLLLILFINVISPLNSKEIHCMAYLEVVLQMSSSGSIAQTANGVSLAKDKGCLAFFVGSVYPYAEDYIRGLEYEGWQFYNTSTTSAVGMIYGLPFANNQTKLIFIGDGRYQIEWRGDRWYFIDHLR
jgi:hypothetical protein